MAEIKTYGEVIAETVYPCRFRMDFFDQNPDNGIAVYFRKPYQRGLCTNKERHPAIVQLRAKEEDYALFYFTWNEDFDIEKLPVYWQDSELIWELKA